jgi:hypothetical protein
MHGIAADVPLAHFRRVLQKRIDQEQQAKGKVLLSA